MKRAWQILAHRRIIIGEIHMIPLKINNYNHMKLGYWELIVLNEPAQKEMYIGE